MTTSPDPTGHPANGGVDRLRDGTPVRVRPARPGDGPRVRQFLEHTSPDALELRYFSAVRTEAALTEILTPGRPTDRVSMLIEVAAPSDGRVIGHGEYVRTPTDPDRAEVAFLVDDEHQGLGAGTLLLMHLVRRARTVGIRHFDAVVLPENQPMIDVFRFAGFPCSVTYEEGELRVSIDIDREPATALLPLESVRPGIALVA